MLLKPKDIIEKISNKKTGEVYKNEEEWKAKGVPCLGIIWKVS